MLSATFDINCVQGCESMTRKDIVPEKCSRYTQIHSAGASMSQNFDANMKIRFRMIGINRCSMPTYRIRYSE